MNDNTGISELLVEENAVNNTIQEDNIEENGELIIKMIKYSKTIKV